MSLIDLASLVLAPTATKEGKVYSAIPDTGDGDMTFSRGSAATRVNSAGLIEKERANLLLQSNTFDTTWSTASTSVGSGQPDKDGGSTAWKLTKNGNAGYIQQGVSTSGVITQSIYAKAGTLDWIRISNSGFANATTYYDLANGVLGTSLSDVIDASIEDLGNGWYRLTQVLNGSGSGIRIFPAIADNDVSGTGGYLYIQDAMLNEGLVAQPYIETTTTAVYEGITDDVPRVDYSGGGCPALKLEPQRTNLFEYSEYFEGSYWGKTQQGSASVPVVTGNYAISPEGVQNATRVQFDAVGSTSSDRSGLVRDFAFTSGTTYSISCWVKATSGNNELVQFRVAGSQVGGEQTATDEWQLFTATHTATASVTDNFGMQVRGNNTTNESDILIYGMQLEQSASYASSYIPTYGTSTTRVADSCSKTGISELINSQEGVIYWEGKSLDSNIPPYSYLLSLSDGTQNNRLELRQSGDEVQFLWRVGGVYQSQIITSGITITDNFKIALKYSNVKIELFFNGNSVNSISSPTLYASNTLNRLAFDDGSGGDKGEVKIKEVILFPTALTDSECIALTK